VECLADERQQFLGGARIGLLDLIENLHGIAHALQ
jgi:hypothetical protein